MNYIKNITILFLAILLFTLILHSQQSNIQWEIYNFNHLMNIANEQYVDSVDAHKLIEKAIKTVLNELDPYSFYISPDEKKSNDENYRGHFEGIGIQFTMIDDTITITNVLADGPCKLMGILPGDRVVRIDSSSAIGLTPNEIPKKLKGPKGSQVDLFIKREASSNIIKFTIIRNTVPTYSVDAAFVFEDTDIGYLKINRFIETTYREFMNSMSKLELKGMKRLILDLRGNPGGYMDQSLLVADEFIPESNIIVQTKSRNQANNTVHYSKPGGKYESIPLIVLVDIASASASEVLTGALQDLDRAIILGVTSFGKGLVQRQFDFDGGAAFRLTIAKYYTPSGRCIQRPYQDKEKFKNFEGRLNLEEAANINHEIEILAKTTNKDSIPPIYKTKNGRSMLGAGGITPDFIVKYDSLTPLTKQFFTKNILLLFVNAYLNNNLTAIKTKYYNNFSDFCKNWNIDDNALTIFKNMAISKGIEWNDSSFDYDKEYIKTFIKSNIAACVWSNNEKEIIKIPKERQVIKALQIFPNIERFFKN